MATNGMQKLAELAEMMNITPKQATALPIAVTVAARKVGLSETKIIEECFRIAELRNYLANACRIAA